MLLISTPTAVTIERLGHHINRSTNNKPIMWKGVKCVFNNYRFEGDEYVMINLKKGCNEDDYDDDDFEEVGRIACKSNIVVIVETPEYIEILEAVR